MDLKPQPLKTIQEYYAKKLFFRIGEIETFKDQ